VLDVDWPKERQHVPGEARRGGRRRAFVHQRQIGRVALENAGEDAVVRVGRLRGLHLPDMLDRAVVRSRWSCHRSGSVAGRVERRGQGERQRGDTAALRERRQLLGEVAEHEHLSDRPAREVGAVVGVRRQQVVLDEAEQERVAQVGKLRPAPGLWLDDRVRPRIGGHCVRRVPCARGRERRDAVAAPVHPPVAVKA
jgi:hypothetical protein